MSEAQASAIPAVDPAAASQKVDEAGFKVIELFLCRVRSTKVFTYISPRSLRETSRTLLMTRGSKHSSQAMLATCMVLPRRKIAQPY